MKSCHVVMTSTMENWSHYRMVRLQFISFRTRVITKRHNFSSFIQEL